MSPKEELRMQQTASPQPMSLMTISMKNLTGGQGAAEDDTNLLTLRILEASEQKLQLIRKLLSPEEFESLSSDLFTTPEDIIQSNYVLEGRRESRTSRPHIADGPRSMGFSHNTSRSISALSRNSTGDGTETLRKVGRKSFSKSEMRLDKLTSATQEAKFSDIQESLSRKRRAIAFFFDGHDRQQATTGSTSLAIELRFGHYMSQNPADDDKYLTNFNQLGRLIGFIGSLVIQLFEFFSKLCSRCDATRSGGEDEMAEQLADDRQLTRFIEMHKHRNCLPYASRKNLTLTCDRLRADHQLERVLSAAIMSGVGERVKSEHSVQIKWLTQGNLSHDRWFIEQLGKPMVALREAFPLQANDSNMLTHHWLVESWTGHRGNGISLSPLNEESHNYEDDIILTVESIKILNHKLVSPEESVVGSIVAAFERYEKVFKELNRLTVGVVEFVDKTLEKQSATVRDFELFLRCMELRMDLSEKLMNISENIENSWIKLSALRKEQSFQGTPLEFVRNNQVKVTFEADQIIDKMFQIFNKQFGATVETNDLKQLEEIQKRLYDLKRDRRRKFANDLESIGLNFDDNKITPGSELPAVEIERRHELKKWLQTARLRITMSNAERTRQSVTHEFRLIHGVGSSIDEIELKQRLSLRVYDNLPGILQVKCEILSHEVAGDYLSRILSRFRQSSTIEAAGGLKMDNCEKNLKSFPRIYCMDLQPTDATSGNIYATVVIHVEAPRGSKLSDEISIVRRLHGSFFKRTRFGNRQIEMKTMLAELMNRIDLGLLSRLIDATPRMQRPFCILDPLLPKFASHELVTTELRYALLAWRWNSAKARTPDSSDGHKLRVFLSQRENLQMTDSLSIEQSKTKLRVHHEVEADLAGFRLIELDRRRAVDMLKQCEGLIKQLLTSGRQTEIESAPLSSKGAAISRANVLTEPRIKLDLHLSGLAHTLRVLVPRRTARRPLMPDRRRQWRRNAETRLGQLVELSQQQLAASDVPSEKITTEPNSDLEIGAFDEWPRSADSKRRLGDAGIASNLRLLVTIQQAHNLPMRIVPQANQFAQQQTRPSSPFYSPSPVLDARQSKLSLPTFASHYLAPPTSYIEAIFQRKQLTSSLAQGKDPVWNETLFFPVEVAKVGNRRDSDRLPFSHLIDECLQLNLYDCRCYVHEPEVSLQSSLYPSSPVASTVRIGSPSLSLGESLLLPEPLDSNPTGLSGQNRLFAALGQRIERHLIGSVRIPLTILLSSGRIEGSFPLDQPLLLDSHYTIEPAPMLQQRGLVPPELVDNQQAIEPLRKSSINLFITLDPPISIPLHVHLPLPSHENEDVFAYACFWERVMLGYRSGRVAGRRQGPGVPLELNARGLQPRTISSSRHIRALVLANNGEYQLTCRYLTPMRPPFNRSSEHLVERIARFVSLLNPLKYGQFEMRLLASNLWFNSLQLLEQSLGGHEEKAILLCNYFLYLGKCSALLLGHSIPNGRCVYVIVWSENIKRGLDDMPKSFDGSNDNATDHPIDPTDFLTSLPILVSLESVRVWDPNSGSCHRLADPSLTLTSIGSIITVENVYANIQAADAPTAISYDIRQKNLWFPLFGSAISPPSSRTNQSVSATLRRDLSKISHSSWRRQLNYLDNLSQLIDRPSLKQSFSVQNEPEYSCFSHERCQELQMAIERSIKTHLLTWRPDRPTYFNRTLSRLLADRLATFESTYFHGTRTDRNESGGEQQVNMYGDWRAELAEVIRSSVLSFPSSHSIATGIQLGGQSERQVISWPVNLTYSSMKSILDGLHASGVHNADLVLDSARAGDQQQQVNSSITQFLVACHVEAYPQRVMSVWLYVAAVLAHSGGSKSTGILF